jgi:hypothetical protein
MKMYIARDKCGILCIHREEPILIGMVWDSNDWWGIDSEEYPSVTFENSPMEVELVIKSQYENRD